ncbi:unnamed protein product, partial [Didymodactylos carnosus]
KFGNDIYEGEILGTSDIKEELKQYYPQNLEEKNNRNRIISTDQRTAIQSSKENNEYKLLNDAIGQQDQILTFVQDIYGCTNTDFIDEQVIHSTTPQNTYPYNFNDSFQDDENIYDLDNHSIVTSFLSKIIDKDNDESSEVIHISDPNDQSIVYNVNKQKYLYAKERSDNDLSEEGTMYLVQELVFHIFTPEEQEHCSADGKIQRTRSFDTDKFRTIDHHLYTLYGVRYSTYRQSRRFPTDLRRKQRSFKGNQKRKKC